MSTTNSNFQLNPAFFPYKTFLTFKSLQPLLKSFHNSFIKSNKIPKPNPKSKSKPQSQNPQAYPIPIPPTPKTSETLSFFH